MKIIKNTSLLLCFLIAFTACKKDHNVLGVDVQPDADGVNATFCDTAIITAYTTKYDSIGIASFNDKLKFLGSNQDPVFGRMDIGLYLNANIPNGVTFVSFGDDANLVSSEIILVVNTLNFVGDKNTPLTYNVYTLDSALNNQRLYFTNNTKLHNKNSLLATYTGTYSVMDGKLVLRIPIDNNYAKSILNNPQYLIDNSTFLNTYKGFYITSESSNTLNPSSAQGVIAHFNLEDPLSGFYLRYQKGTPSATKQDLEYRFQFSGTNGHRFNTLKFDASTGSYLLSNQLAGNKSLGQQNLFLKGMGATKVKFQIPFLDYLKNYTDSFPIAINRAEFIFNVDPSFAGVVGNGVYFTPPKLAILPLDSLGKEIYAIDQLSQTDFNSRYGGDFDAVNNRYVFNLARHVQAIVNKERKNWGFHLVVADPERTAVIRRDDHAERVVLAGNNNTLLRPKFNVSFIKYKQDK